LASPTVWPYTTRDIDQQRPTTLVGGHYAPAVAAQILSSNANLGQGEVPINLKGVGLGDGWVDPIAQYKSFPVYGYENGLIGLEVYAALNKTADACVALIAAKKYNIAWVECQTVMMGVAFDGALVNQTGIVNVRVLLAMQRHATQHRRV